MSVSLSLSLHVRGGGADDGFELLHYDIWIGTVGGYFSL